MNLLDSINILAGLRDASEEASRSTISLNKSRNATLKRKAGVIEDGEEGSAAPSPRPVGGGRERLGVEKKEKRGGSVPSTREVSVKIEDGAESVTSSVDGSKRECEYLMFSLLSLSLPSLSFHFGFCGRGTCFTVFQRFFSFTFVVSFISTSTSRSSVFTIHASA